jgi:hypothetical protein
MSQYSNQNISQDSSSSSLIKLTKVSARYIEVEEFKNSDHHRGYFCYNCNYFIKPHHCALVTDEGSDALNNSSNIIAPHGICALWTPNKKEIRGDNIQGKSSDLTNTDASSTFSCETCNQKFETREELKEHNIKDHSQGKSSDLTNTDASSTFSCETCNQKFETREELKEHNIKDHQNS